jgi:hypothetical protein
MYKKTSFIVAQSFGAVILAGVFLLLSFVVARQSYAAETLPSDTQTQTQGFTTEVSGEGEESLNLYGQEVKAGDLVSSLPRLLPGNPFYFIKEWQRGLKRAVTFNSVKKADLELEFVNERAAELKRLEEVAPQGDEALRKALSNYQSSQERLKSRLLGLKETSANPNVDRLIEKAAERTVLHEKLFDELAKKFAQKEDLKRRVAEVRAKAEETSAEAARKDDPEKFAQKLEKALLEAKGGKLEHVRSLEIIDRLENKAHEETKDELAKLREEFKDKFAEDVKEALETAPKEEVQRALEQLPGDVARRQVLLEEVRREAEARIREVLSKANEVLQKAAEQETNLKERAQEQIKRAQELVERLERRLAELGETKPRLEKRLAEEARQHLKEAVEAFEAEKFGEAFGQARSAEVLARNALRFLEEERSRARETKVETELRSETPEAREEDPCAGFVKQYQELLKLREAGQISEADFNAKTEPLKRAYEACRLRYPERAVQKAPAPSGPPEAVDPCYSFQKQIIELKQLRVSGRISEDAFWPKYDSLNKEYEVCRGRLRPEEAGARVAPSPARAPEAEDPCSDFQRQVVNLKNLFGRGQIERDVFDQKSASLNQEYDLCRKRLGSPEKASGGGGKTDAGGGLFVVIQNGRVQKVDVGGGLFVVIQAGRQINVKVSDQTKFSVIEKTDTGRVARDYSFEKLAPGDEVNASGAYNKETNIFEATSVSVINRAGQAGFDPEPHP